MSRSEDSYTPEGRAAAALERIGDVLEKLAVRPDQAEQYAAAHPDEMVIVDGWRENDEGHVVRGPQVIQRGRADFREAKS